MGICTAKARQEFYPRLATEILSLFPARKRHGGRRQKKTGPRAAAIAKYPYEIAAA
jgi:hypothetical protein